MALNIGALFATIGIDTSEYTRSMLAAQAINAAFGQSFANFIANPIAGSVAIVRRFGASAIQAAEDTSAWGEGIERLGNQTGISLRTIQAIEAASKAAGLSAETAAAGMGLFANRLGEVRINGAAAKELFSRIGVDLSEVVDTEEGLRRALDAIISLPTPAERAAAAADLFGRAAGPALVDAIGGGSAALDALIARFTRIGQVIDNESVAALSKGGDAFDAFALSVEGVKRAFLAEVFVGFTSQSADAEQSIERLAATVNQSLLPLGRQIGESLSGSDSAIDGVTESIDGLVIALRALEPFRDFFVDIAAGALKPIVYGSNDRIAVGVNEQVRDFRERIIRENAPGPSPFFLDGEAFKDLQRRRSEVRRAGL